MLELLIIHIIHQAFYCLSGCDKTKANFPERALGISINISSLTAHPLKTKLKEVPHGGE